MRISLWEWVVARDERGGSVGISETCHGAMDALAKALVQAGRPRSGRVTPVILTSPVQEPSHYLRGLTKHTAVYDGEVIRWS
jgi:hypothetical protein